MCWWPAVGTARLVHTNYQFRIVGLTVLIGAYSDAAMTAEALPMVERLGLQQDNVFASPAPCLSWSGEQFGLQIHLVQNG